MKFLTMLFCAFIMLVTPVQADQLQDAKITVEPKEYLDAKAAVERKDYKVAYDLLRPLADKGYANAQFRLGQMYSYGAGVKRDYAEAFKWYLKAAEQGQLEAQVDVGSAYAEGSHGVTKDYTEAMKWFHKSADKGFAPAQFKIGRMYFEGTGVKKDYAEGMKRFRKSADQGYELAQLMMGTVYMQGAAGVTKDNEEAYFWGSIAATPSPDDDGARPQLRATAAALRDMVAQLITPEQKASVDKRIKDWKPVETNGSKGSE